MKYVSRFLFTGAILLVSLMIFNGQESERNTQTRENPDIEHIELQAEICFNRIASSSVLSFWRNSGLIIEPLTGKFNDTEYLIRLKIQLKIHMELKTDLDLQSGPYLQHQSSYEDPLIA